jgi:hypothetical protein
MTMWVAHDSRKCVKMSAVLPQMGGATLTRGTGGVKTRPEAL